MSKISEEKGNKMGRDYSDAKTIHLPLKRGRIAQGGMTLVISPVEGSTGIGLVEDTLVVEEVSLPLLTFKGDRHIWWFGYSICSKNDVFCKKRGRTIAHEKMIGLGNFNTSEGIITDILIALNRIEGNRPGTISAALTDDVSFNLIHIINSYS